MTTSDTLRLAQQHFDEALALAPQNELVDFATDLLRALSGRDALDLLQNLTQEGQARTVLLGAAIAVMNHVEKRDRVVRSN